MSLNWPQLVAQGRAKDIGVAWSEEEQEALAALIAHSNLDRTSVAPYVRDGILTVKEYEAALEKAAKGGKPVDHKTRAELEEEAKTLGVPVNPDMTDAILAREVKKAAEVKAAGGTPRAELEAKATALGIAFTAGTKDATLVTKIAAAEAKPEEEGKE